MSASGGVIIAGSLYVAGEARDHLVGEDGTSTDVWAPAPGWEDQFSEDDEDDEDDGDGFFGFDVPFDDT